MADKQALIAQAYKAFNQRDVESALALMTETVTWPKASEGGRAAGKEEVRAYWARQWQQFAPHVEPVKMIDESDGTTAVKVHQLVRSLSGAVLSDSEVCHVFTMERGLISRMDLREGAASLGAGPSAAFPGR